MSPPTMVSLIITTYNWPEALRLTLQSVLAQTREPEEIIVADDGSGPETAGVVKEVMGPSGATWLHVRHEDKGVRQSRIKNLAVKHSGNPYLIFVDQDVVLHPEFVADHLAMARRGSFLQGKRCLLPPEYTENTLTRRSFHSPPFWTRGLGNRKNNLRIPAVGRLLSRPKGFETSIRGCNLSMDRADFLTVDGFDEIFDQSWGREDSDICYRLFHLGLRVRVLWFQALQYHLHHEVVKNWDRERLDRELGGNLKEKRTKAIQGISRLSSEGGVVAASKVG